MRVAAHLLAALVVSGCSSGNGFLSAFDGPSIEMGEDQYHVDTNGSIAMDEAGGVLSNDVSDVALTAELVSGTAYGTLEFHPDGAFTYTPVTDFFGEDSFTYRARYSDEFRSEAQTVTIDVRRTFELSATPLLVFLPNQEWVDVTVDVTATDGAQPPVDVRVRLLNNGGYISAATAFVTAGTPKTVRVFSGDQVSWQWNQWVGEAGETERTLDFSYRVRGTPGEHDHQAGFDPIDLGSDTESVAAICVDDAGRSVAVGRTGANGFALRMAYPDGSYDAIRDPSFGTNGAVVTAAFGIPKGVVCLPDGELLVLGLADGAPSIVRLFADGAIDPSYPALDVEGAFSAPASAASVARNLVRRPDGTMFLGGTIVLPGGSYAYVAKLDESGSLVATYGSNGVAVVQGSASAIAVDSEERAVVVGEGTTFVARFDADGAIDSSFNGTGIYSDPGGSGINWSDIAVHPTGRIVAARTSIDFSANPPDAGIRLLELTEAGNESYDSIDTSPYDESVGAAGFDAIGRLVLVGSGYNDDLMVCRRYDSAFNDGDLYRTFYSPPRWEHATALAFSPDGWIAVGGRTTPEATSLHDIFLTRIWE